MLLCPSSPIGLSERVPDLRRINLFRSVVFVPDLECHNTWKTCARNENII
jgi:hypothetical protein